MLQRKSPATTRASAQEASGQQSAETTEALKGEEEIWIVDDNAKSHCPVPPNVREYESFQSTDSGSPFRNSVGSPVGRQAPPCTPFSPAQWDRTKDSVVGFANAKKNRWGDHCRKSESPSSKDTATTALSQDVSSVGAVGAAVGSSEELPNRAKASLFSSGMNAASVAPLPLANSTGANYQSIVSKRLDGSVPLHVPKRRESVEFTSQDVILMKPMRRISDSSSCSSTSAVRRTSFDTVESFQEQFDYYYDDDAVEDDNNIDADETDDNTGVAAAVATSAITSRKGGDMGLVMPARWRRSSIESIPEFDFPEEFEMSLGVPINNNSSLANATTNANPGSLSPNTSISQEDKLSSDDASYSTSDDSLTPPNNTSVSSKQVNRAVLGLPPKMPRRGSMESIPEQDSPPLLLLDKSPTENCPLYHTPTDNRPTLSRAVDSLTLRSYLHTNTDDDTVPSFDGIAAMGVLSSTATSQRSKATTAGVEGNDSAVQIPIRKTSVTVSHLDVADLADVQGIMSEASNEIDIQRRSGSISRTNSGDSIATFDSVTKHSLTRAPMTRTDSRELALDRRYERRHAIMAWAESNNVNNINNNNTSKEEPSGPDSSAFLPALIGSTPQHHQCGGNYTFPSKDTQKCLQALQAVYDTTIATSLS